MKEPPMVDRLAAMDAEERFALKRRTLALFDAAEDKLLMRTEPQAFYKIMKQALKEMDAKDRIRFRRRLMRLFRTSGAHCHDGLKFMVIQGGLYDRSSSA